MQMHSPLPPHCSRRVDSINLTPRALLQDLTRSPHDPIATQDLTRSPPLTPLELVDRLAALIPPPRQHRHRLFGVLAPHSPLRSAVTALAGAAVQTPVVQAPARPPNPPSAAAKAAEEPIHSWAARYAWALLVVRIDEIFSLLCPNCGAELRVIAFICEAVTVPEILAHLGEPTSPPR